MKFQSCITLLAACAALGACTAATSVDVGGPNDTNRGPTYHLPTTVIPLTVKIEPKADRITVAAAPPIYIADRAAGELRLNSIASSSHAETFDIGTTEGGLLTTIKHESDGRLDEALVNLGKSAGSLFRPELNLSGPEEVVVLEQHIDLAALAVTDGDAPPALLALNRALNAAMAVKLTGQTSAFLGSAAGRTGDVLTLSVRRAGGDRTATKAEPDELSKCNLGFCYRRAIPYIVTARFFDGTIQERVVEVPNGAPVRAARMDRGVFTKWTNTAVLTNGMLTQFKYTTDSSEFEQIALLPFNLVGGALDGLTKQGELWTAASTRLEAETEYKKAVADAEKPKPESLRSGKQGEQKPLFSMTAGTPETPPAGSGNRPHLNQPPPEDGAVTPTGPARSGNPGTED